MSNEKFYMEGFPIINRNGDYFEVKAIDYWEPRRFYFTEIKSIVYYKGGGNWPLWPFVNLLQNKFEPYKLKIAKKNGGDWTYDAPPKFDKDFSDFVKELDKFCSGKI